jgi:CoA-transferase family III
MLDRSRPVAGNMLSLQLADFGAEVGKSEDPGKGDPLRDWRVGERSLFWEVYARASPRNVYRTPDDLSISGFVQSMVEALCRRRGARHDEGRALAPIAARALPTPRRPSGRFASSLLGTITRVKVAPQNYSTVQKVV